MKISKIMIMLVAMFLSMHASAQLLGAKVNEYGYDEINKSSNWGVQEVYSLHAF